MRKGVRVGQLFGIDIRINWSWLLIALLIRWILARVVGEMHSDWGPTLVWTTAMVAAGLLFASVLAHELAHSLVAKALGIPVKKIILFLFGGGSNIERHPDSPKSEFLMAIAGPLTSFLIGGTFVLASALNLGSLEAMVNNPSEAIGQLSPISFLILWLGSVNLVIGLFNMIPSFPLEGGRIFRSVLWAWLDNLRSATRWTLLLSLSISWLMIAFGVALFFGVSIPFFGAGVANGVWLTFIGWFLKDAAAKSQQQVALRDILEEVPVMRMMRRNLPAVPAACSIDSLIHDHVMGTDDRAFAVVEDGRAVGLVALEDVHRVPHNVWGRTTLQQIMTANKSLVTITKEEAAAEALDKLNKQDVRQLPVLHGDKMVGLLRRRDIVRWLQFQSELNA